MPFHAMDRQITTREPGRAQAVEDKSSGIWDSQGAIYERMCTWTCVYVHRAMYSTLPSSTDP
jgi:hypothetical protein